MGADQTQMPGITILVIVIFYAAIVAFGIFVYAKIVGKTGCPWPWVFIIFVPIVNIVMLAILAFKEWPVQRELALTRQALEAATGSPFPPGSQLAHYGNYQIGSGMQGYAAQGYSGQAYAGQGFGAGQNFAGQGPADQFSVDSNQQPGQYDPYSPPSSDNPYGPRS